MILGICLDDLGLKRSTIDESLPKRLLFLFGRGRGPLAGTPQLCEGQKDLPFGTKMKSFSRQTVSGVRAPAEL